jgi:acetyltransferase-like isoleucine patch superfamily enzyme
MRYQCCLPTPTRNAAKATMPNQVLDDLAALLSRPVDDLLRSIPQLGDDASRALLEQLLPLMATPSRPPGPSGVDVFSSDDAQLRAQILTYHATELMTDRERAQFLGLPNGCRIRERAKILAPEKLECGENVWIGEGAVLDAQGGLEIGDNTQIGLGVMVWSHTSHRQATSGETGSSRDKIAYRRTSIGSNCFIAGPSVIAPGVTIGDRVIISPLTFVDRDVADDEVLSGPRSLKKLEERVAALEAQLAGQKS